MIGRQRRIDVVQCIELGLEEQPKVDLLLQLAL